MKIHYLITSLEQGGGPGTVPQIVQVLRSCGHDVEVTACEQRDGGSAPLFEAAGIHCRLLFKGRKSKLTRIRAFIRLLRSNPPDVVWTSLSGAGVVGAFAGRRVGIPVVSFKNNTSRWFHSWVLRGLTRLWVADSVAAAHYLERRAGVRHDRIEVWPLFRAPAVSQWPTPWNGGGVLRIGSVGRLHSQKGYDYLIDAVARLVRKRPELAGRLSVTLVGDGPDGDKYRQRIEHQGLQSVVFLAGPMDDVWPFLATLHLYVQPSRFEGMCLAAHEAMTAGLPVLATPVGEIRHSIEAGGGGVLLDQSDVISSLVCELGALLDEPDRLREMGLKGKAYIAANYSAAAFAAAGAKVAKRVEGIVKSWRYGDGMRRPRSGDPEGS